MDRRTFAHIRNVSQALIFSLIWSSSVFGQVTANAVFNPERVETGDTFSLRVLVSGTNVAPKEVEFAAWDSLLPVKNVLARSEWRRSGPQWVRHFTLIAFDSASLQLPPLVVRLHLGEAIPTNPLQLTVAPTPATADLSDMETIRDIRREPAMWLDYWPWGAGALALLLVLRWLTRRRKPRRPATVPTAPAPAGPPVPAHQHALSQLALLEKQQLPQKGEFNAFYTSLSLILREYLEQRYGIAALESTTREIAQILASGQFPKNLLGRLEDLLNKTDWVKYASTLPPPAYHEIALQEAREIVKNTQNI